MNKVLITGFEPFCQDGVNPSQEIVRRLDHVRTSQYEVTALELPCVFHDAVDRLIQAIQQHNPQIVICLGQSKGRSAIAVERVAINVMDAIIPDNQAYQPIDVPIVEAGPVAFWSTLPIKAIVAKLQSQGIPAVVSQSAGTYVCNEVFYRLMHWAAANQPQLRAGFIHVPALPEQVIPTAGIPSMHLELLVDGIRLAIQATIENEEDIELAAGATH